MTLQGNALSAAADSAAAAGREIAATDWSGLLDWDLVLVNLLRAGIIIVVAFVIYRAVRIFTGRLASREVDDPDPIVKRLREQRGQTVAGLLNNVALMVIVAISALLVIGLFMEDIAPLLATVGILGLAISFGAQSLVKDVITGGFILMEGQYAIGDVIRIKEIGGLVEKITLRTTVLRDLHGVVHVVPNGEITMVSNMTKQWSRALLDVGVAYKEDVDRVMEILAEIGSEMRADPEWGPLILEDIEIPGIEAFADSAVVIRMLVKTLPLKQWNVARQFRRRIKLRFDREGIEIPFPHRTVYWGEDQMPAAATSGDGRRAIGERLGAGAREAGDDGRG